MKFVQFMTSMKGRAARIVMGIALLLIGQLVVGGTAGTLVSILAFIPMSGGVLDFCVVGTLLGYPFSGSKAREKLESELRS